MRTPRSLLLLPLLLIPRMGFAQEPSPSPSPAPTPAFRGALEAGATATSGNTQVETYSAAAKADGAYRGWALGVRGAAVYAENRNVQSAGSWEAGVRGDRALVGKLGSYLRLSIDGDRFKGINTRKGAGAGLSAAEHWKSPDGAFDRDMIRGEAGYQYYREDLARTTVDHDIHAGRAFAAYAHAFTKETVFSQEVEALYDFQTRDRFLVTSLTALAVKLRANLAFKVSETVKVDTVPNFVDPADETLGRFEKVDTLTTFAMILSF